MRQAERRRSVRAPARLAMELKLSGRDFGRLETINVSANGVYFKSPSYIAPLTRLEIVLLLPDAAARSAGAKREVSCEGVVVRTQPEAPESGASHYDIACFFTAISEADRTHLESYILNQLTF
jgi:hypothetical protein